MSEGGRSGGGPSRAELERFLTGRSADRRPVRSELALPYRASRPVWEHLRLAPEPPAPADEPGAEP